MFVSKVDINSPCGTEDTKNNKPGSIICAGGGGTGKGVCQVLTRSLLAQS